MKYKFTLSLLLVIVALSSVLQGKVYRFEDGIPGDWTARRGTLNTVDKVYKEGGSSLLWEYKSGGKIEIEGPMGFTPRKKDSESNALSIFSYWVYQENPSSENLTFTFFKNGREIGTFQMSLDFRGWRTAWLRYEWDIGSGIMEDPDKLVIQAPSKEGTLYWDLVITSAKEDSRSPIPDSQVPFVGKRMSGESNNIWNKLYDYRKELSEALQGSDFPESINTTTVNDRWEEAFFDIYGVDASSMESWESWNAKLEGWNINRRGGKLTGYPLFFPSHRNVLEQAGVVPERYLRDFGRLYFAGALAWRVASEEQKPQWEEKLLLMFDFLKSQGWADGSGQGVLHHLGYSMRELFRGLYVSRDILSESGRLEAAQKMVSWYSGVGRIFGERQTHPSVDVFNTQLEGMLIGILMHSEETARHTMLEALRDWLDYSIGVQPGIEPIFKNDGSIYHHQGLYPAYANGGLRGLGPVLFALGNSAYSISEESYQLLKKALLAYRFYSNKYHWPRSISGRHPNGSWTLYEEAFYWISRVPKSVDRELGKAYLRLSRNPAHTDRLKEMGLVAEKDPEGTLTMPWGGITIHRRDHWMALVRGHSKYLWSHETYRGANLYGRYLSHGQLELLHRGDPVNPQSSGFTTPGWDWFHLPGATNPVAGYDYLKADIRNLDDVSGFEEMLLSRESFNGGVTGDNGGLHAVKLHGHDKYGDDMAAAKSYVFYDDWILCLGSGIHAKQLAYPIHTTLFQVSQESVPGDIIVEKLSPDIGNGWEGGNYLEDPTGVGYFIPGNQNLVWKIEEHEAPDQKKDVVESGKFAKAWIDHGVSPGNAQYLYAIHMNGKLVEGDFPYEVLRHDSGAHIVSMNQDNVIAHVFLEASLSSDKSGRSPVESVDSPSLIWTKSSGKNDMVLSFCQPDLKLYEQDGDQWTGDGQQQEVSIYSRPWQDAQSQTSLSHIRLRDEWSLQEQSDSIHISYPANGGTILSVRSVGGQEVILKLKK